jgi:hypothetical protein
MIAPQAPDPRDPGDYPARARAQLAGKRRGVVKKLASIVARPVAAKERSLQFDIAWGLYNGAFVYAVTRQESGEYASDRRPLGSLFEVDPPPGREDDPDGYAEDRPAVARLILDALADWWGEAGGGVFALPAKAKVEGDPLRLYDLCEHRWETDERAVRAAELTADLAARLRALFAQRFRDPVVRALRERLSRVADPTGCRPMFLVDSDDGPYRVSFRIDHESGSRSPVREAALLPLSRFAPVMGHESLDWEALEAAGVDSSKVTADALHELLAHAWEEAGGYAFPIHAMLAHVLDDDFSTYDLVRRRWATDSLGRSFKA